MDIINGAIDSLVTSTGKEEWTPVKLSIADTTVAVMKDKARVVSFLHPGTVLKEEQTMKPRESCSLLLLLHYETGRCNIFMCVWDQR